MVKVITYGTYDLLHYGHIRLLERAKALGDYLIVGVTADDFDKSRGKINVQQSLEERIAAVQKTGLADKIIVEEYEGQKIDDIRRYGVDIFTVGSDWEGVFDYLAEYCKVVYLPRTEGISSSEIRSERSSVRMGMVGYSSFLNKFYKESQHVNSVSIAALCTEDTEKIESLVESIGNVFSDYDAMLDSVDAVYIHSHPSLHYDQCLQALKKRKHVLCESPLALSVTQCEELFAVAGKNNCVLMEAIRTAYMTAYSRLVLLIKGGKIGNVISVDATCASLRIDENVGNQSLRWGALDAWGPTALLPVFQLLGDKVKDAQPFTILSQEDPHRDIFTKISFIFDSATATIKTGTGVKSEGELIISGTKGYVYVPAPWWKTDYFEIRYEDQNLNKRYFYQVQGEGIRYELVAFSGAIRDKNQGFYIDRSTTRAICSVMEMFRKY